MARGFESKQVESQQADREARGANQQPEIADPAAAAARRTLELALMRARDDLSKARTAAHRAMLEQAIAALTAQLEQP
jgi:hypothetical protein